MAAVVSTSTRGGPLRPLSPKFGYVIVYIVCISIYAPPDSSSKYDQPLLYDEIKLLSLKSCMFLCVVALLRVVRCFISTWRQCVRSTRKLETSAVFKSKR